jgi:class 3 adenylate cyclase
MKLPASEIKYTRIISLKKKAWPKRKGMAHRMVWRPEAAPMKGLDTGGLLLCTDGAWRTPGIEGCAAMFEEFLSDLGRAFAAGLLTGGAFVAIRGAALGAVRQYLRAAWRRDQQDHAFFERRLAAILAVDVVGYSRLMNADEEGTHVRLLNCRREVMEPKIREYRGRIVKHTGDGALIEFGSAVDAARCALDMQKAMMVRNAGVPQSRRIDLRMAVGLGDVIIEPEDIYGHAVNVVARIEGLAAPGGICVSADIWGLVRGTIGADFVDLGKTLLKNIADPVHVFAISPDV